MDNATEGNIQEGTKSVRVTYTSEAIALRYGSSVSKGIAEMGYKLSQTQTTHPIITSPYPDYTATTSSGVPLEHVPLIGEMTQEAFWKKLKAELETFLERAQRGY